MTKEEIEQIEQLNNKELLKQYSYLISWFGDDYALDSPQDEDYETSYLMEAEILKRMDSYNAR